MSIYCPLCYSSQVTLLQQSPPASAGDDGSLLKSVAGLAALGVTIAKQTSVATPLIGGIAGAVLGGLFGGSGLNAPVLPSSPRRYLLCCQNCDYRFEVG